MHVLFASQSDNPSEWTNAIQARLPGTRVTVWDPAGPATGAEVALVWKPPARLFEREKSLKVVFNLGAGVDALLKMPGLSRDVTIVRLEDAGMSDQMAEYVVFALARISRGFGGYDRDQSREQWRPLKGTRRADWPVGVLGLGVMGQRVAQVASDLGYPVTGWSRSPRELQGMVTFSGADQLPAFLKRARVLVNVLPLTAQTRGILSRGTLSQTMRGAHLINVGRGEHLVEDDLLPLLDSGQLSGATLDVFHAEPLPAGHPFWSDDRIHITPHIAACTLREETIEQICTKIGQLGRGLPFTGVVDRRRGY